MKNSNNAKTIAMVQDHMIRSYGEGKKGLYEEIKHRAKNDGGVARGLARMVNGAMFLDNTYDAYKFLNRLGYTKAQLDKMDVWERYKQLIIRDGTRFYNQYKKEQALKKSK